MPGDQSKTDNRDRLRRWGARITRSNIWSEMLLSRVSKRALIKRCGNDRATLMKHARNLNA